jgi:hypothetical protein
MHQLMHYLHHRLMVESFNQDQVMATVVKKMVKSVARATGSRISTNKWAKLLTFLSLSTGSTAEYRSPDLDRLNDLFNRNLDQYIATSRITVMRCRLIWNYINRATFGRTVLDTFIAMQEDFADDQDFFFEFASKAGLRKTECNHLTDRAGLRQISLFEEGRIRTVNWCQHCVDQVADRYAYSDNSGTWIERAHLVVVHASHGTYEADNRQTGISYNTRHQRWVDASWSPYANLIDGYHSSRARGFNIIDSAWFRQHRRAFGMELEIQTPGSRGNREAGRVHDVLNPGGEVGEYCFFERDGSIGDGFEIVTQPAGLDIHRDKMALFLNDREIKQGMRSHEGGACGLHIHVGRQYVTQAQIYRIQAFLNDVRNEGIVRKVSRRYGTNYARIDHRMGKLSPEGKHNNERYEALNVSNRDTIEFRIFRGSLRYESVMAALEFVNALLDFCMPGQTSILDFNSIGFRRFLMRPENQVDTHYLRPYLSINSSTDNEAQVA